MADSVITRAKDDTILDYDEKELYKLLTDIEVPVSSINQIMKLYSLGYPLNISATTTLSTKDLRHKVSILNSELTTDGTYSKTLTMGVRKMLSSSHRPLKKCIVGTDWDTLGSVPVDIDVAAFLLDNSGKISNIRTDVVFFNQMSQSGIHIDNENTGTSFDAERICINFNKLSSSVERIVFVASIFSAASKEQNFGMITNAYTRILDMDDNEKEIYRITLDEIDPYFTAATIAEFYKKDNQWNMKVIKKGHVGDLNSLVSEYI